MRHLPQRLSTPTPRQIPGAAGELSFHRSVLNENRCLTCPAWRFFPEASPHPILKRDHHQPMRHLQNPLSRRRPSQIPWATVEVCHRAVARRQNTCLIGLITCLAKGDHRPGQPLACESSPNETPAAAVFNSPLPPHCQRHKRNRAAPSQMLRIQLSHCPGKDGGALNPEVGSATKVSTINE